MLIDIFYEMIFSLYFSHQYISSVVGESSLLYIFVLLESDTIHGIWIYSIWSEWLSSLLLSIYTKIIAWNKLIFIQMVEALPPGVFSFQTFSSRLTCENFHFHNAMEKLYLSIQWWASFYISLFNYNMHFIFLLRLELAWKNWEIILKVRSPGSQ